MEQKTTSSAKLSEPCECQLLRVTLPVPFEEILLVIISVHFGKSRNPYARPDASPPQGRGRGQPHPLSPLILLCPTMMILVMRRLLYTARHQHRQILGCNEKQPNFRFHSKNIGVVQLFHCFQACFWTRLCERRCRRLSGARLAARHEVSGMADCYVPPSYRAYLLFSSPACLHFCGRVAIL